MSAKPKTAIILLHVFCVFPSSSIRIFQFRNKYSISVRVLNINFIVRLLIIGRQINGRNRLKAPKS